MRFTINNRYFNKEELANTPKRIRKYYKELKNSSKFNFKVFDNQSYNQMIILKDIEFASLCSHHLLPFIGKAHVGYLPNKKICGISKLARALDKFASKPQLQERLTNDLAKFLQKQLSPLGVIVVIEAQHDCMRIRGIKKQNAVMITSAITGVFRENISQARHEFLELIG